MRPRQLLRFVLLTAYLRIKQVLIHAAGCSGLAGGSTQYLRYQGVFISSGRLVLSCTSSQSLPSRLLVTLTQQKWLKIATGRGINGKIATLNTHQFTKKIRRFEHYESTYLLTWWHVLRCLACRIRRWSKTIDRPIIILPVTIVAPTFRSICITQEICRTSERLGTKKSTLNTTRHFL